MSRSPLRLARTTDPPAGDGLTITDREFEALRELIHREAGIALGPGKKQLLVSRLARRLRHLGLTSFSQYHRLLTSGPGGQAERRELFHHVTTHKTDFFREAHHFDLLRDRIVPELIEKARRGGPAKLRVWSAACSTGEEPYSIAMTLHAALAAHPGWDVRILASDIDATVIATAQRGIYPEERVAALPEAVKRAGFLRGTGANAGFVQVRPEVRDLVTFRRINLVESPWPIRARFDLVFCRNVIIYFDRATQRRLFERIAEILTPGGHLFVGHSENLHWMRDLFVPLQGTVYARATAAPERSRA